MTTSLPATLLGRTRDRIVAELGLREVTAADGGPLMPLVGAGGPVAGQSVGTLRVWDGGGLLRMVSIALVVPPMVDSHMLFAFTRPDSAVPHFTLDSVFAGGSYAFHLDLIPRLELAANVPYARAAYAPLTETFETTRKLPGLTPAAIGPLQAALMSPWMLVSRADEVAFRAIDPAVDRYVEHWLGLVKGGVPAAALEGAIGWDTLAARDARNKAAIFDPAIDPVWANVARLVGEAASAKMREHLTRGLA